MNPSVHFIISAPRSGSTWLATALNAHPQIVATENRLFGMFCEIWPNRNGRTAPRITADCYLRTLAGHLPHAALGFESAVDLHEALLAKWETFLAGFLRDRSGRPVIVDKVTPYLGTSEMVVSRIREHFPDAKILHLVRDGRDVATSGVFDWLGRDPENRDHPRESWFSRGKGVMLNRFFDDASLEKWCHYWVEPFRAVQAAAFPADAIKTVRYESMLADHAGTLAEIFRFLGVDAGGSISEQCAAASAFEAVTGRARGEPDPLSKARRGVAGDWRNWFTRHDAQLFQMCAGPLLIELGYEQGDRWVETCPAALELRN